MSGLLDILSSQLDSGVLSQLGSAIGADKDKAQQAMGAALPVLVGALAKNANKSPEGAESLAKALERDHDGSILDSLGGLGGLASMAGGLLGGSKSGGGIGGLLGGILGGGKPESKTVDGAGILGHLLGGKQPAVEAGISQASGLQKDQAGKLLVALAPIVMGALGKAKKEQNLDASGLANMLSQERRTVEQKLPSQQVGGLLGMLDSDGDGNIVDDLAKIGGGALGSILGK